MLPRFIGYFSHFTGFVWWFCPFSFPIKHSMTKITLLYFHCSVQHIYQVISNHCLLNRIIAYLNKIFLQKPTGKVRVSLIASIMQRTITGSYWYFVSHIQLNCRLKGKRIVLRMAISCCNVVIIHIEANPHCCFYQPREGEEISSRTRCRENSGWCIHRPANV